MSTRTIGNIGENIACKHLERLGLVIVERNYQKKWGELDIIAIENVARETLHDYKPDSRLHFFEVKSVTGYWAQANNFKTCVGERGNFVKDVPGEFRPEDNVHSLKIRNIRRMIETYLTEKYSNLEKEVASSGRGVTGLDKGMTSYDMEFQFHVLCVYINMKTRKARIKWLKNVIL